MKGKATLILSDARTGEVVRQIEEHNLVTNALSNIFNPPHGALLHGFDYSSLFTKGLPMWNELLGGIVLLGNTETESADNILLGKDIVPVATAGTEYAGSCVTRGTLNINESYQTENGYHFTWDFGTDKANGTISCVCLTSKLFGNSGFSMDNSSESAMFMAPNKIGTISAVSSMSFDYGYGQYVGTYEDGLHVFMYLTSDGYLEFRRYSGLDTSALRINDTAGLSALSEPVSVATVPLGISVLYEDRYFLDSDKKTVYYFGDVEATDDTTTTISYAAVNFETLESAVHTVTLNATEKYYPSGAVFGDRIYLMFADGVNEFSLDGTLLNVYELAPSYSSIFFVMNGCLMLRTSSSTVRCFAWGDKEIYAGHAYYPVGGAFPQPYIGLCERKSHYLGAQSPGNKPVLVIASDYKATINNLSSPIQKTSEHTLKIVYDITN